MNRQRGCVRMGFPSTGMMVFLAAGVCMGCGPQTGNVSGTITYKGKPLPVGSVTFVNASKEPVGTAAVRDGYYSLTRTPVGPVTILVTTPPVPSRRNVPPPPPPRGKMSPKGQSLPEFSVESQKAPPPITIPDKYANANESGLTFTVQPGDQEHNIDLP